MSAVPVLGSTGNPGKLLNETLCKASGGDSGWTRNFTGARLHPRAVVRLHSPAGSSSYPSFIEMCLSGVATLKDELFLRCKKN